MNIIFENTLNEVKIRIEEKPENLLFQICQVLKSQISHYDWVGFYLHKNGELILDAYEGKPTEHTRIPIGKGICGQVAVNKKTMIVQDVSQVDNYIACSLDVKSEIVVPVLKNNKLVAELDIDSHSPAPFTTDDSDFLEQICALLESVF